MKNLNFTYVATLKVPNALTDEQAELLTKQMNEPSTPETKAKAYKKYVQAFDSTAQKKLEIALKELTTAHPEISLMLVECEDEVPTWDDGTDAYE